MVQWLRDGLQIIDNASKVENLALMAPENEGVYFVPAFTGLGLPGGIRKQEVAYLALPWHHTGTQRAALEAIAYQSCDVLKAMEKDANMNIVELRVDGGATANHLLMQFQCDILNCRLVVPLNTESTAMGQPFSRHRLWFWESETEVAQLVKAAKQYEVAIDENRRLQLIAGWNKAAAQPLHGPMKHIINEHINRRNLGKRCLLFLAMEWWLQCGIWINPKAIREGGMVITMGWAMAVLHCGVLCGRIQWGPLNPAVSLALAIIGKTELEFAAVVHRCTAFGLFVGRHFGMGDLQRSL